MKLKFLAFFIPLFFVTCCATAEVWDATKEGTAGTGSEGPIEDASAPSTIDNHIRQALQQVRKRLEVEHHFGGGDGTNDDNGMHRQGSAKCYFQDSPPTSLNDSGANINIALYDNSQETAGTGAEEFNDSANNSAGAIEDDVGHARCWIDSDAGNRFYVYRGVAGDNTPSTIAEGWEPIDILAIGQNLVARGGFEQTDGDGDPGANNVGGGWSNYGNAPSISYVNHTLLTEGPGLGLKSSTGAADTDSGVTQQIGVTQLLPDTQYRVQARVKAVTNENCQLWAKGGASSLPADGEADSTTTGVFETLTVLVTTDSSPSAIQVRLIGPGNDDTCVWDHVSMVQLTPKHSQPTPVRIVTQKTSSSTFAMTGTYAAILEISITSPGANYYPTIHLATFMTSTGPTCFMRLWNDTTSFEHQEWSYNTSGSDSANMVGTYIATQPIPPGTTQVYQFQVKESGSNCTAEGTSKFTGVLEYGG